MRLGRGTFRRAAQGARLIDAAWAALAGAALALLARGIDWLVRLWMSS